MDTSTEPPPSPLDPADPATRRPPRRTGFYLTLASITALIGAWVYVLFFYDPGLMLDELADRRFPTQAEQVCAAAVEQLDSLEPANLASDAGDRADTVEQSNLVLRQMVLDLRPLVELVPAEPADVRDGVSEWLDDWDTYIGDREQYVDGLREDPETRFLETTKGTSTKGITRAINGFAEVNEMTSCTTPGDLS
jgi:hypothetical protein